MIAPRCRSSALRVIPCTWRQNILRQQHAVAAGVLLVLDEQARETADRRSAEADQHRRRIVGEALEIAAQPARQRGLGQRIARQGEVIEAHRLIARGWPACDSPALAMSKRSRWSGQVRSHRSGAGAGSGAAHGHSRTGRSGSRPEPAVRSSVFSRSSRVWPGRPYIRSKLSEVTPAPRSSATCCARSARRGCTRPIASCSCGAKVCTPRLAWVTPTPAKHLPAMPSPSVRGSSSIEISGIGQRQIAASAHRSGARNRSARWHSGCRRQRRSGAPSRPRAGASRPARFRGAAPRDSLPGAACGWPPRCCSRNTSRSSRRKGCGRRARHRPLAVCQRRPDSRPRRPSGRKLGSGREAGVARHRRASSSG